MVEKRNATNRLRLGLFEIVAGVCGVLILIRVVLFLREGYKPTEISASKRLVRASSRELALRLSLGEMTQGKEKDSSEN